MIQKLLTYITNLAAIIFGSRANEKVLRDTITDLQAKLAAEDANDASREAALTEANEKLSALNTEIEAASGRADEIFASITADQEVPIVVDPEDGNVEPAPVKGVRIAVGFNSKGKESVSMAVTYADTPLETLGLIEERVINPVKAAIAGAVPADVPVTFDFFLNVNGENQTPDVKGEDLAALLAGQKAALEGYLGIVNEQIASLS